MCVERMKQCDDIVALSKELDIHRRLLYRWRDQLDPVEKGEWPPPQNSRDELITPAVQQTALRCRRTVSCARRMHGETHSNSVPLVSWPLVAPFCAKCAYFECLNLGVQSTHHSHLRLTL